jgi:hypothetical protein
MKQPCVGFDNYTMITKNHLQPNYPSPHQSLWQYYQPNKACRTMITKKQNKKHDSYKGL